MHRREYSSIAASSQIISCFHQHFMNIQSSFRSDSQRSQNRHQYMIPPVRNSPHFQPLPPRQRRRFGQILLFQNLKTYFLRRFRNVTVRFDPSTLDLVIVDRDSDYIGFGMSSDGSHRTTDAASDIEDPIAGFSFD
uniref:Uncharacterized protein n=1 Tax=Cucumis melo TaxID=3656 RepID=A0A9I9E914_CUCME